MLETVLLPSHYRYFLQLVDVRVTVQINIVVVVVLVVVVEGLTSFLCFVFPVRVSLVLLD